MSAFSPLVNFGTLASKPNDFATESNAYSVFPNPVQSVLNVEHNATSNASISINLMDMTGRVLKQIHAKSNIGLHQLSIDMNGMAKGIYTMQIFENNVLMQTSKIQKQD